MRDFKEKLFNIIEPYNHPSKISLFYDYFMIICIIISMIPLAFKTEYFAFKVIDKVTVTVFIVDYLFRMVTADIKIRKAIKSYFIYPFTPMAIIDLLSILPSVIPVHSGFKVLRILRMIRTFRVFRSLKIFRYSKNLDRILKVLKKESKPLMAVFSMTLFYIIFTALIMFNIEPKTFDSFFQAVYWAAISLTSIGYGDIYPTTSIGQLFTMISAIVGIAIIALPSGIITAGYIEILNEEKNTKKK